MYILLEKHQDFISSLSQLTGFYSFIINNRLTLLNNVITQSHYEILIAEKRVDIRIDNQAFKLHYYSKTGRHDKVIFDLGDDIKYCPVAMIENHNNTVTLLIFEIKDASLVLSTRPI